MSKKKQNNAFDPIMPVLTKQEIIEFCDRVLEKWNKNPKVNTQNIMAMNAVKMSVLWTDEDSLKSIWSEIFNWAFSLLYKNVISQTKEENVDWSRIMEKIKRL